MIGQTFLSTERLQVLIVSIIFIDRGKIVLKRRIYIPADSSARRISLAFRFNKLDSIFTEGNSKG